VKLKDGSVFRGTILEYVHGDHVDLLLPSGQTRRFPMADVAYQGPASGASEDSSGSADDSDSDRDADDSSSAPPPPTAPPAPARSQRRAPRADSNDVDVHVTSDRDDVALLVRTGQSDFDGYGAGYRTFVAVSGSARNYALVCNAPCDAQLPKGVHRMALSLGSGRAVETDKSVTLEGPSTIRAHYDSRSGTRAGGWVLFGLSMAAGLGLFAAGELHTTQNCFGNSFNGTTYGGGCANTPAPDQGQVAAGLAIAIVGPLLSLALILQHDQAQIEIVPDNGARLIRSPGRGGEALMAAPASAPGPAVRVRF
jgi:hypothetical protein